jgi:hypothetical protein
LLDLLLLFGRDLVAAAAEGVLDVSVLALFLEELEVVVDL